MRSVINGLVHAILDVAVISENYILGLNFDNALLICARFLTGPDVFELWLQFLEKFRFPLHPLPIIYSGVSFGFVYIIIMSLTCTVLTPL